MTKPTNIQRIEVATSRPWQQWLDFFESAGSRELDHPTIAKAVQNELMNIDGINAGWWAQHITVAYEQHIGRRAPGQTGDGNFQVSASRTMDGSMDDAIARWIDVVNDRDNFNGVAVLETPRMTQSENWRYWRVHLTDNTLVNVSSQQKAYEKSMLTITHTKLVSAEAADAWKTYWKELLQQL